MAAISHGGAVFACPAEAAEDLDGMSFDVEAVSRHNPYTIIHVPVLCDHWIVIV